MWALPNGWRKRKGWSALTRSDVTPQACQAALKGVVLKGVPLKEVLLASTTVWYIWTMLSSFSRPRRNISNTWTRYFHASLELE